MSVDILNRSPNQNAFEEQVHGDAGERTHLLEVADTLAAMEAQFQIAEPDEKKKLQVLKDSLIEELIAEKPGHTLLNEVVLLASVYQRRVTETILPQDGSSVKAFGTRDQYNQYLEETYILHEKPQGGYHYVIKRQTNQGELLFELDDQADLRITRQANRSIPSHRHPQYLKPDSEGYLNAVRELFGTTLTATGTIRARDEQQRAGADMQALFMVEESSFANQFLHAESSADVMHHIDSLMVVEPTVISQDAMRSIIASRKTI
ncbi:MAG: hypothetical protein ABIR46_01325 [Candidatus Saccharimonadales bacterium]